MHRKPTCEDISKLHNEINLYANQRLVITTTAITVFAIMASLVTPVTSPSEGNEIRSLSLILPTVLMIILGIMLWYCQTVLQQIHVISTYLVETESSSWEEHYHCFIEKLDLKSSSDNLPLFAFAALGSFSMALSIAMYFVAYRSFSAVEADALDSYSLKVHVSFALFAVVSVLYWIFFTYFWCRRNPKRFREKAGERWREVLSSQSRKNVSLNHTASRLFDNSLTTVWDNSEDDIYNNL